MSQCMEGRKRCHMLCSFPLSVFPREDYCLLILPVPASPKEEQRWCGDGMPLLKLECCHCIVRLHLWKGRNACSLHCKTTEDVFPVDADPHSDKLGGLSGDF